MGKDLIQPTDPQYRKVPENIKKDRRFYPYFKDCIGAIDGTHIPAVVPAFDQIRFIGRKGTTTQNVLTICNFNMEFVYVWAGWKGQAHDTRIFYEAIGRHDAHFPHPPPGKYYLVDAGYPNPTSYLGPYKEVRYHLPKFQGGPSPTGYREVFNRAHSSLCSAIERAFGVLKQKWGILTYMPSYPCEKQVQIVVAAMTLHNYIRRNNVTDTTRGGGVGG
ncbi:putative nuclease HARBI1 [Eucalyptus grandis]|uniref:putative nuclease HARBI1 n=1 Tax=Eucalyptus grandis TaxID=71139 RepID=UPI00192F1047|nr:putative nuclease HARBI1 [Eucalyptus grandis]